MTHAASPIIEFYRLIEEARPPQRADRSAIGTLPMRAARYCDAITSASGFGWWAFSPMDLQLLWDGTDIYWQAPGSEDWLVLLPAAQFPGMMRRFDAAAPEGLRGCAPPFLTALPEPGLLQIWTGLMARTAPDWSVLIRAPANLPTPGGIALFEGIVETDRWFGPIFINLRFTRSHKPVRLRADFPLAQLQPLPRVAYDDATLGAMTLAPDLAALKPADWEAYRTSVVAPNDDPDRPYGSYAIAARKRRRPVCPSGEGQERPEPTKVPPGGNKRTSVERCAPESEAACKEAPATSQQEYQEVFYARDGNLQSNIYFMT